MKELTKERFVEKFREILESEYFVEPQEASAWQIQSAVGKIIMARITPDANASLHAGRFIITCFHWACWM